MDGGPARAPHCSGTSVGSPVVPDVELTLPTKDGTFRPNNYDGRFHGPVRLREALASFAVIRVPGGASKR